MDADMGKNLYAQTTRWDRTGCADNECSCGGSMELSADGNYVEWNAYAALQASHAELVEALRYAASALAASGCGTKGAKEAYRKINTALSNAAKLKGGA